METHPKGNTGKASKFAERGAHWYGTKPVLADSPRPRSPTKPEADSGPQNSDQGERNTQSQSPPDVTSVETSSTSNRTHQHYEVARELLRPWTLELAQADLFEAEAGRLRSAACHISGRVDAVIQTKGCIECCALADRFGEPDYKPASQFRWAEARVKIARMTLTIKLDRNWSSFQLANSAPPLSVTGSAIAPSARIHVMDRTHVKQTFCSELWVVFALRMCSLLCR